MTEAIVWLVLWVAFAFVGAWAVYALFVLVGGLVGAAVSKPWPIAVFVFLGWLLAASWFVFAAIQVVLQVVSVVQLL